MGSELCREPHPGQADGTWRVDGGPVHQDDANGEASRCRAPAAPADACGRHRGADGPRSPRAVCVAAIDQADRQPGPAAESAKVVVTTAAVQLWGSLL